MGYIGITLSVSPSICPCLSGQYLLITQPFFTKLDMACIIMRQCVMQKNWFTIFNVKVTARAYIIKIWLFLLYLLHCWPICNQIWFDTTTLSAQVFCAKIGLLCWRSRSRQRFKMLMNVCPDDIFRIADHYDTKLGIITQHHEPECHAEKKMFTVFNVKITARADCWSVCNQTWFDSTTS